MDAKHVAPALKGIDSFQSLGRRAHQSRQQIPKGFGYLPTFSSKADFVCLLLAGYKVLRSKIKSHKMCFYRKVLSMSFNLEVTEAQAWIPEVRFLGNSKGRPKVKRLWLSRASKRLLHLKSMTQQGLMSECIVEAHAMLTINSPYIIKLAEFHYKGYSSKGFVYLLEEYIDGSDLADVLTKGKRFYS